MAPTVTSEGGAFQLVLNAAVDVAADLPGLQHAFDCGDGAGYGAFGSSNRRNCTVPEGSTGTRTVRGKIRDQDGSMREYSASVAIVPNAPVVTIISPGNGDSFVLGSSIDLVAMFTDRNSDDTHTCTVDWGDGTAIEEGSLSEDASAGNCAASHTFGAPGEYVVTVAVDDSKGNSATAEVRIIITP
jgi:trimeric autotransporter adhesin